MATSPESFRQVKNILRKLDQSIDAARDRRLTSRSGGQPAPAAATPAGGGAAAPNRAKPLPPRNEPNRGFIAPAHSPRPATGPGSSTSGPFPGQNPQR